MTSFGIFLLFSLVSNNLTNNGRRHLKLLTNCHVSWDVCQSEGKFGRLFSYRFFLLCNGLILIDIDLAKKNRFKIVAN